LSEPIDISRKIERRDDKASRLVEGMGLSGEICYRDKPSNARRPITEWLAVIQANTRGIGHVALRFV